MKQTVLLDPCLSKTCTGLFCDAALFTKLFLNIQHCLLSLQCKKHTNNLKHFLYQSNLFQNISSSALIQGYLTALSRSSLKFDSPSMFQINRTNSLFQDLTMSEMLVAHTYVCSSSVLHTGSNRINQTKHIIYVFIVFSPFNFVDTCTLKL